MSKITKNQKFKSKVVIIRWIEIRFKKTNFYKKVLNDLDIILNKLNKLEQIVILTSKNKITIGQFLINCFLLFERKDEFWLEHTLNTVLDEQWKLMNIITLI